MKEGVSVTIYNSEYKLRGENADRIKEAASLVDQQMRVVANKSPMQNAATTAVLSALNTAEQYLAEQDRCREQSLELAGRIDAMANLLKEVLAEHE